ncbi:hypothetical protein Nhal_0296 [Nitrosococcus halophilus Nc 4]|uniref:Uncharacterized protein n=1 Tax=Nitrosococcus halophilus (strain Nc4) TaxID=472759 RepID=D5BUU5_NITHN|nr:penicillin-insensitive murein endopeptidase [Nitrosococcus halophilus]ADE13495.1 hypothetical protein Nhal_0296 [Nitrosococcus halophilus Nc 4]
MPPGQEPKKNYHTPHILRVGSVHSEEARYKAEVKCLQKRLEELGFKSGVVKQITEKIEVNDLEKTVKNLKYHPYSDRNFSTATTNTPGLYDNDEALAVWQFQGLAMCQASTGALPRLPSRCTSKIFGKIRYKAKQVDKTTVKILNATNSNPFWKWAQFQPQQCAPPHSTQKCLWRKKWKQPQVEWGTKALVEVLQNAAKALNQASASSTANYRGIEIGDISYPTGGSVTGHGSHERGIDVDINTRALCADGTTQYGAIEYWQTAPCPYDQAYMEVLLKALAAQKYVDKLLFHDPAFLPGGARYNNIPASDRKKITCSKYQQHTPCPGNSHTHHIHMRLKWEN